MHKLLASLIIIGALCHGGQAAAEVAVITHPDTGVTSVSSGDLKNFYLGKSKRWSNGTKVVITLNGGPIADSFLDAHVGKSARRLSSLWKRIVFTGKGKMPERLGDDDAVVAFVAETPGAVGYVDAGSVADGVVALAVE